MLSTIYCSFRMCKNQDLNPGVPAQNGGLNCFNKFVWKMSYNYRQKLFFGERNLDKYMDPQDGNIFKRNIAGHLPGIRHITEISSSTSSNQEPKILQYPESGYLDIYLMDV